MADYLIQDSTLDAIADAINAKTGGSAAMTPAQMVTAIGNIPSGGGGGAPTVTVTIAQAASTVTGTYTALKDACVLAVGDVPFIARFRSGNLPNYCLYELRYVPEAIADYFQTPTADTGTGAWVQMVRAPYNGYFNYHQGMRESRLSNVYLYNIDANTVYDVVDVSFLYEGVPSA